MIAKMSWYKKFNLYRLSATNSLDQQASFTSALASPEDCGGFRLHQRRDHLCVHIAINFLDVIKKTLQFYASRNACVFLYY